MSNHIQNNYLINNLLQLDHQKDKLIDDNDQIVFYNILKV